MTPFSSAQDLTRVQSASSLVQFVFAAMMGINARGERMVVAIVCMIRQGPHVGGPQSTLPASKVSGSTFFRDDPTEVVRQDHHEPLGGQIVAPLPRPSHYHFNQDLNQTWARSIETILKF